MSEKLKIAVLYGGFSNEREVSLKSGKNCIDALNKLGYAVYPIDVDANVLKLVTALDEIKPDIVFNALHGLYGEDGCVQGLLEMMQIPYTHSGVEASAIAMDKERAKSIFKSVGIPVADAKYGTISEVKNSDIKHKMVLKPVKEGSSIGIYIVESTDEIDEKAWSYGRAMLEEYIDGREITVGIMNDEVLGIAEITTNNIFYDYKSKYTVNESKHIFVDDINQEITDKIKKYALDAHKAVGCRGLSRCDFRVNVEKNKIVLLEINTQPGMTSVSLIPDIAMNNGINFEDIIKYLVENAKCDMC